MIDKFTPGPWRVVNKYKVVAGQGVLPREIVVSTISGECELSPGNADEANARLIAAAPDMLAALEFAERRSRQPEEGHTEYYERIAEEFFVQHGYLAPGKDDPVQSVPPEQRRDAWEKFLSEPAEARRAAIKKARGEA